MKKKRIKTCSVLLACMLLFLTSCNDNNDKSSKSEIKKDTENTNVVDTNTTTVATETYKNPST